MPASIKKVNSLDELKAEIVSFLLISQKQNKNISLYPADDPWKSIGYFATYEENGKEIGTLFSLPFKHKMLAELEQLRDWLDIASFNNHGINI